VTTTDKIIINDLFRSRGSGDAEYTCDVVVAHKLHSLSSFYSLAIRRARAQLFWVSHACCALENSMLERLLLLRRLSTSVAVFVKGNHAFEPIDHKNISVDSIVMFTFDVDPVADVMAVSNGRRALVFPEALQQMDETDATLVAVCQISCGDQKSQPLSRLHVMHDVWCVHPAFEEARFTLLRSMHELIMRCSSLAAGEQTARAVNNLLAARSHWDFSCDEQSYPLLSVMLRLKP